MGCGSSTSTIQKEENEAATKIQTQFRGKLARDKVTQLKQERDERLAAEEQERQRLAQEQKEKQERNSAAIKIQALQKGRIARKQLQEDKEAVIKIQALQRGKMTRQRLAQQKAEQEEIERQRVIAIEVAEDADDSTAVLGKITIKYNHYTQEYDIRNGRLKKQNFFSLLDVLEGAKLHLSDKLAGFSGELYKLSPRAGTYECYSDLEDTKTYYVIVEKNAEAMKRLRADRERRERERKEQEANGGDTTDARVSNNEDKSSCSCLWGNPCVVEYNCNDWENRMKVARANGMKQR